MIGSIFIGGVHEMGPLVVSIRHKGKSVSEMEYFWHNQLLAALVCINKSVRVIR
ncbi:MAG TPA: carbon starvation CstA family protein [Syntrophomonas sp.]|nr:carbon starvation CstA family protein [Syntrophomonas sp.]